MISAQDVFARRTIDSNSVKTEVMDDAELARIISMHEALARSTRDNGAIDILDSPPPKKGRKNNVKEEAYDNDPFGNGLAELTGNHLDEGEADAVAEEAAGKARDWGEARDMNEA